jgi:hypothetical protein
VCQDQNLWLYYLAVDSQNAADRKRSSLTSSIFALGDQMFVILVFADNQGNGIGLNAGRLQEAKLLDNIFLQVCGNGKLFIVPRLALVDERTRDVARVFVLDEFNLIYALIFVLLKVVVFFIGLFFFFDLSFSLHSLFY